jgi:hypothetical protein
MRGRRLNVWPHGLNLIQEALTRSKSTGKDLSHLLLHGTPIAGGKRLQAVNGFLGQISDCYRRHTRLRAARMP